MDDAELDVRTAAVDFLLQRGAERASSSALLREQGHESSTCTGDGLGVTLGVLVRPYRRLHVDRSAIVRAPRQVRKAAVLVGLSGAAAAWLGITAAGAQVGGFLLGMGALFCGTMAVGLFVGEVRGGRGDAPCPGCGAPQEGLERSGRTRGIRCAGCGAFLEVAEETLGLEELEAVADEAVFGAALPASLEWPPGCVVCGAEVTQHLPISARESDVGGSLVKSAVGLAMASAFGVGFIVLAGKRIRIELLAELHRTRGALHERRVDLAGAPLRRVSPPPQNQTRVYSFARIVGDWQNASCGQLDGEIEAMSILRFSPMILALALTASCGSSSTSGGTGGSTSSSGSPARTRMESLDAG